MVKYREALQKNSANTFSGCKRIWSSILWQSPISLVWSLNRSSTLPLSFENFYISWEKKNHPTFCIALIEWKKIAILQKTAENFVFSQIEEVTADMMYVKFIVVELSGPDLTLPLKRHYLDKIREFEHCWKTQSCGRYVRFSFELVLVAVLDF